jgi:phospholipid/cholesterol/gamma-HCH transport system substrate-binding protein
MNVLRSALLVGGMTMVSVALLVVFLLRSNRGVGEDGTYQVWGNFRDVTGIAEGTKVTIAGFPVGQVVSVKLEGEVVRVTLRVKDEIALYTGTRDPETGALINAASLSRVSSSLLGDYYLEFKPGATGARLRDGDQIPQVTTASAIDRVVSKMEGAADVIPVIDKIAKDIQKITANAAAVFGNDEGAARFDELSQQLVATSRNLNDTSAWLRARLKDGTLARGGALDKGIEGFAKTAAQTAITMKKFDTFMTGATGSAKRSLANVELVTDNMRKALAGTDKGEVKTVFKDLADALQKAKDSLKRLDKVVADVEKVSGKIASGEGTVGRLIHDDKLITDMEAAVGGVGQLVDRVNRLETGIDLRGAYYGGLSSRSDERFRSQLGLRIQPTKDKYYFAAISGDIYNLRTQRLVNTQSSVNGGPTTTTDEAIRETDGGFKFGFQYARRWGPLVVRGGLIEQTAGFGMDLYAAHDRVRWENDFFRFTDEDIPRFRSTLLWRFLDFAYLQIGGDDIFSPSRADLFAGVGLTFTDNDLLLLFTAAPSVNVINAD